MIDFYVHRHCAIFTIIIMIIIETLRYASYVWCVWCTSWLDSIKSHWPLTVQLMMSDNIRLLDAGWKGDILLANKRNGEIKNQFRFSSEWLGFRRGCRNRPHSAYAQVKCQVSSMFRLTCRIISSDEIFFDATPFIIPLKISEAFAGITSETTMLLAAQKRASLLFPVKLCTIGFDISATHSRGAN